MHCVFCKYATTEVIETRVLDDGHTIRRRRTCLKCQKRFTTYERIEELPILVIKRDNKRERFEREKLRGGLLKAAEKTTVSADQVEKIISQIESELKQQDSTEVESNFIGGLVAKKLKKMDKVAYIRFASVFKRFLDVEEFEKELKRLV